VLLFLLNVTICTTGDGVRVPARERPAILPNLSRNVPAIRIRQATNTLDADSDTGGVSLPALPVATSTSSSDSPRPRRSNLVARNTQVNAGSKSSRGARQVARVQNKQKPVIKVR
jgi:hypothetical protein